MDSDIVGALINVVQLKDMATAAHTWRVALYAQALAEAAGLPQDQVKRIMNAAVLHDIGKIDIPQAILGKPGRLTDEEYETIKTHTTLGYDRLKRMGETDDLLLSLVRSHHERLDGSGYPDGLKESEIPVSAQYFAVIDTFDAMTSLRPYRRLVGPHAARQALIELKSKAGQWYHPQAVQLFGDLYERGTLDWIMQHFNDQNSLDGLSIAPDADELANARVLMIETVADGARQTLIRTP